jgi:hypothetical protein
MRTTPPIGKIGATPLAFTNRLRRLQAEQSFKLADSIWRRTGATKSVSTRTWYSLVLV